MRKYLTLLSSLLLAVGCIRQGPPPPPMKLISPPEMTWIVEKIMAKWENQEKRRLRLEHSEICYCGNTPMLRLELSSQAILEMCEARFLFADFIEDLLREINTDPIISGQLSEYPFTPEQLLVDINFESFFGKYVDPFYIGYIEMRAAIVRYYAFDQKDRERYIWHARCEPYLKTREIAAIQRETRKQFHLQNPCTLPNYFPELYELPGTGPECRWNMRF
jgi:hypothetical protein